MIINEYIYIYNMLNKLLSFQGSGNLDAIQIIKKLGASLEDSYLDEGEEPYGVD